MLETRYFLPNNDDWKNIEKTTIWKIPPSSQNFNFALWFVKVW